MKKYYPVVVSNYPPKASKPAQTSVDAKPAETDNAANERSLQYCLIAAMSVIVFGTAFIVTFKEEMTHVIAGTIGICVGLSLAIFGIFRYYRCKHRNKKIYAGRQNCSLVHTRY
jgi:uncharacterized membrane protein YidH (DUF202 family)